LLGENISIFPMHLASPDQGHGNQYEDLGSCLLVQGGTVNVELDALSMDIIKLDANSPSLQNMFSKLESFEQLLGQETNRQVAISYTRAANLAYHKPGYWFQVAGMLYCDNGAHTLAAECSIEMHMRHSADEREEEGPKAWIHLSNFKRHIVTRVKNEQKTNTRIRSTKKSLGSGTPRFVQQECLRPAHPLQL